jgi:hypothetical protein
VLQTISASNQEAALPDLNALAPMGWYESAECEAVAEPRDPRGSPPHTPPPTPTHTWRRSAGLRGCCRCGYQQGGGVHRHWKQLLGMARTCDAHPCRIVLDKRHIASILHQAAHGTGIVKVGGGGGAVVLQQAMQGMEGKEQCRINSSAKQAQSGMAAQHLGVSCLARGIHYHRGICISEVFLGGCV